METSSLKKLITKLFDTVKTKSGETGCFSNLYCLLASQASIFFNSTPFSSMVSQDTLDNIKKNFFKNCSLK